MRLSPNRQRLCFRVADRPGPFAFPWSLSSMLCIVSSTNTLPGSAWSNLSLKALRLIHPFSLP